MTTNRSQKILLIMPSGRGFVSFSSSWRLRPQDYGKFPPLGLLYIASSLKQNGYCNVKVIDAASLELTSEDLAREIESFRPEVVGIASFSVTFAETLSISNIVKSVDSSTHVCVGGPHVKTFPHETIGHDSIDSIVIGEGEDIFSEIVKSLSNANSEPLPNGALTKENISAHGENLPINRVAKLDRLPFPARNMVSNIRYYSTVGIRPKCLSIITSRGCPYKCTFCDVPFNDVRIRSVEGIAEEIDRERPGKNTEVFFFDDTFNLSIKRFSDLCDMMAHFKTVPWSFRGRVENLNENLLRYARKAGCYQVHAGVETSEDKNLEILKKGITFEKARQASDDARKAGIRMIANFMIALPFEKSEKEVYKNVNKLIEMNPYIAQINILQLIPGTEIFEQAVMEGIVKWEDWKAYVKMPTYNFVPASWNKHIPQDQLGRIWRKCYIMFYLRPGKIMEMILGIRSLWEFWNKLANGLKLIR